MKCNDSCLSCQYVLSNCFFWHENLLPFTETVSVENQPKPEISAPGTQQVSQQPFGDVTRFSLMLGAI